MNPGHGGNKTGAKPKYPPVVYVPVQLNGPIKYYIAILSRARVSTNPCPNRPTVLAFWADVRKVPLTYASTYGKTSPSPAPPPLVKPQP